MSVAAIASFRPLQGSCLRRATTGVLSVHVKSRTASLSFRAVVTLPPYQTRCQSTSSEDKNAAPKQDKPVKPQISFGRFVKGALGASLRNLAVAVSPRGIRSAYKDSPGLTSMNLILYVACPFNGLDIFLCINKCSLGSPSHSSYPSSPFAPSSSTFIIPNSVDTLSLSQILYGEPSTIQTTSLIQKWR